MLPVLNEPISCENPLIPTQDPTGVNPIRREGGRETTKQEVSLSVNET